MAAALSEPRLVPAAEQQPVDYTPASFMRAAGRVLPEHAEAPVVRGRCEAVCCCRYTRPGNGERTHGSWTPIPVALFDGP